MRNVVFDTSGLGCLLRELQSKQGDLYADSFLEYKNKNTTLARVSGGSIYTEKTYSLDLLESLLLAVTFLNCWTRGLRSLPGFSRCRPDLFLRPVCGTVCDRPTSRGRALPRRRYSSSTSPRW